MNYKWNYEAPDPATAAAEEELARQVGIHPALGKLLFDRGIRTEAEARHFFRPQLTELHDPFMMDDMQVAVDRLNLAMGRKERILVYGDYDVDGCTAVALVYKFLQQYYSNIDYYIPDRYEEGYGISKKGIDFAAQTGVGLIVVLDCGIKAIDEIAYAKSLGIDFIICDHHVPDAQLPCAVAILNPKRTDNHYPDTHLSGCGVGFKFMQAFAASNGIEFNKLMALLDLCAVSIASDIVPVMGENRVLAYHGLRCLNSNPSIGLQAIIEVCGLADRELTMNDIIFKIGPRINASGRMQNGKEAVELLVEKDFQAALEKAGRINLYNEARKDLDKQMTEEAVEQVKDLPELDNRRSIVIYNEAWHKGVIGIVASRLTEQYYRPAVVLTRSEGMATGSARSVSGFDVYRLCRVARICSKTLAATPMLPGSPCPLNTLRSSAGALRRTWRHTYSMSRLRQASTLMPCSTLRMSPSAFTSSCASLRPSGRAMPSPSFAPSVFTIMAQARWLAADRNTSNSNWWTTRATM